MIYKAYFVDEAHAIDQFIKLCKQIIQKRQYALVYVHNKKDAEDLSSSIWKSRYFVPHGIFNDEFWEYQPILISEKINDFDKTNRNLVVNFCDVFFNDNQKQKSIIMWNCGINVEEYSHYQQYKYDGSRWHHINK